MSFQDHHTYSTKDVDEIADKATKAGATRIITTKKSVCTGIAIIPSS